jgi:hypothetical protein
LFDHRPKLGGHLGARAEGRLAAEISAVELPPDIELELLEAGHDGRLKVIRLAGVRRLLELLELTDRLIERCDVHTLRRHLLAQLLCRLGTCSDLALELAGIADPAGIDVASGNAGSRPVRRSTAVLAAATPPLRLTLVLPLPLALTLPLTLAGLLAGLALTSTLSLPLSR